MQLCLPDGKELGFSLQRGQTALDEHLELFKNGFAINPISGW